ncbi:MAG TPA: hypothetical protein VGQ83_20145 [Polyangia bacterium]
MGVTAGCASEIEQPGSSEGGARFESVMGRWRKPHPHQVPLSDAGTPQTDAPVAAQTDAAVPPQSDAAVPPQSDAAAPPQSDAAVPPQRDAAVPPQSDAAVPPQSDAAVPPQSDAAVQRDASPPQQDAGSGSTYCYGDVPCAPVTVRQPSAACAAAGANTSWVVSTGPNTTGYPESSLALPGVGTRVKDPDLHACLTQATPAGWMNGYARFSAFNADSSRMLVRKSGGAWFILDYASLGTPTRSIPASGDDAAPRWHGRDPDVLFYLSGTKLMRYQVTPGTTTVALDASAAPGLAGCGGVSSLSLGGSEGDGSAASRYWGFMVTTSSSCGGNTNHYLTADLQTGTTWVHHLPSGRGLPDNSSISLTGKYFITNAQGSPCSGTGSITSPCGVMAYTITFDRAFMVHPNAGHSDEALGADGHDVEVVKSNSTDYIEAIDLETHVTTRLVPLSINGVADWDFHVSGGNWAMPGWVLLSQDSYDWNTHYLSRQIVAVELKDAAVARVVHLAHHRTRSTQYWTKESHAAVNADFTRVAWHTNWGGSEAESANMMFFLELPPSFLKQLP